MFWINEETERKLALINASELNDDDDDALLLEKLFTIYVVDSDTKDEEEEKKEIDRVSLANDRSSERAD